MKTLKEFFLFMEQETETFSFEELEKYVGNTQRAEYLEKTLRLIDTGSSRMVFDLGDSVLKLAINCYVSRGITYQNRCILPIT
jgi:hypothetical protein